MGNTHPHADKQSTSAGGGGAGKSRRNSRVKVFGRFGHRKSKEPSTPSDKIEDDSFDELFQGHVGVGGLEKGATVNMAADGGKDQNKKPKKKQKKPIDDVFVEEEIEPTEPERDKSMTSTKSQSAIVPIESKTTGISIEKANVERSVDSGENEPHKSDHKSFIEGLFSDTELAITLGEDDDDSDSRRRSKSASKPTTAQNLGPFKTIASAAIPTGDPSSVTEKGEAHSKVAITVPELEHTEGDDVTGKGTALLVAASPIPCASNGSNISALVEDGPNEFRSLDLTTKRETLTVNNNNNNNNSSARNNGERKSTRHKHRDKIIVQTDSWKTANNLQSIVHRLTGSDDAQLDNFDIIVLKETSSSSDSSFTDPQTTPTSFAAEINQCFPQSAAEQDQPRTRLTAVSFSDDKTTIKGNNNDPSVRKISKSSKTEASDKLSKLSVSEISYLALVNEENSASPSHSHQHQLIDIETLLQDIDEFCDADNTNTVMAVHLRNKLAQVLGRSGGAAGGSDENVSAPRGVAAPEVPALFNIAKAKKVELQNLSSRISDSNLTASSDTSTLGKNSPSADSQSAVILPMKHPPNIESCLIAGDTITSTIPSPAAALASPIFGDSSNVLKKVASFTAERSSSTSSGAINAGSGTSDSLTIKRLTYVPEKLNFASFEKFEGQMLMKWLISSFQGNGCCSLSEPDLSVLTQQYCTNLLSVGVIKPISDKQLDKSDLETFNPFQMYQWTHKDTAPAPLALTPGRLDTESLWPHSLITAGSGAATATPQKVSKSIQANTQTESLSFMKGLQKDLPAGGGGGGNGLEMNEFKKAVSNCESLTELYEIIETILKRRNGLDLKDLLDETEVTVYEHSRTEDSEVMGVEEQSSTEKTADETPSCVRCCRCGGYVLEDSAGTVKDESAVAKIDQIVQTSFEEQTKPPAPPSFNSPPPPPPPPPFAMSTPVPRPPPPPPALPLTPIAGGPAPPPPPPPPPPAFGSPLPSIPRPPPPPFPHTSTPGPGPPPPPPMPFATPGKSQNAPPPPPPFSMNITPSNQNISTVSASGTPKTASPAPLPMPAPGGWFQSNPLRKTALNPPKPMRPLYWTRIVAPKPAPDPTTDPGDEPDAQTAQKKQLWQELDETNLDNIDEFTELFSRQAIAPKAKPEKAKPVRQRAVKVLDSKRSQNVGIFSRSLHFDFCEIEHAIYHVDTAVVSLETLQKIMEMRATDDELVQIKEAAQGDIPLDLPEQFLLKIAQISSSAERISCIVFQAEFEEGSTLVSRKLEVVKQLSYYLLDSEDLKLLFSIILTLGNYMNGGNRARGQADGFGLEILSKLKDVKSKDSKVTLLHFIVKTYINRRRKEGTPLHEIALPIPEPADVERAVAVDFDEVKGQISDLNKKLTVCKNTAERVVSSSDEANVQPFKDKMEEFIQMAGRKMEKLNNKLDECRELFVQTMIFYQFKPKLGPLEQCTPNVFFELWTHFTYDLKDIWKKEIAVLSNELLKKMKQSQLSASTNAKASKLKPGSLKERLLRLSHK